MSHSCPMVDRLMTENEWLQYAIDAGYLVWRITPLKMKIVSVPQYGTYWYNNSLKGLTNVHVNARFRALGGFTPAISKAIG